MSYSVDNAINKLEQAIKEKDWQKVLEAKKELDSGEIIFIEWSYEDVLTQAGEINVELTKEQAIEILSSIEHKHNASLGINWDVIQAHIENN